VAWTPEGPRQQLRASTLDDSSIDESSALVRRFVRDTWDQPAAAEGAGWAEGEWGGSGGERCSGR